MERKFFVKDGYIMKYNRIEIRDNEGNLIGNPTIEQLNEAGWVEYVYRPHPQITLRRLKAKAMAYDKSKNVNEFFVNGKSAWIDRETRNSIMHSTKCLMELGIAETTLWLNDEPYTLSCELVVGLLIQLEKYALDCYNVTARHLSNISKLTTEEEFNSYDFKTGYPEKLEFTV